MTIFLLPFHDDMFLNACNIIDMNGMLYTKVPKQVALANNAMEKRWHPLPIQSF